MVVASDSHSNMYGGLGCLGTPVVRTDAAGIWATGQTWWQVRVATRCAVLGACAKSDEVMLGGGGKIELALRCHSLQLMSLEKEDWFGCVSREQKMCACACIFGTLSIIMVGGASIVLMARPVPVLNHIWYLGTLFGRA
jgi:hypothetical protein